MTWVRPFILIMVLALAVEAAIFYSLAALGASGELVSAIELIWLCVVVFLTALLVD